MQSVQDSVIKNAIATLSKKTAKPLLAVVLGSGVTACNNLFNENTFDYKTLFGIAPTVHGHKGSLTIGKLQNMEEAPSIAIFRGRFHLYEGHDWDTVTLIARLVVGWEIPNFVITNAAGGLNKEFNVGDLMVINAYRDHLHPSLKDTGLIPAVGAKPTACENALTKKILELGNSLNKEDSEFRQLRTGCYIANLGPTYETHAEVDMLRKLNADAVGMSTVPELKTAANSQTMACGLSVITNTWSEDIELGGHEEVLQESKLASIRLEKLLTRLVKKL